MNNNLQLPLDDFPFDHPRAQEVIKFFGGEEIVKVPRDIGMQSGRCYWNVDELIKKQGGKSISGWMLEWHPNLVVQAMHHAIYQSPEGALIDVSSPDTARTSTYTSFIPSNKIAIDLQGITRIPRRSFPLVDDELLTRYLYLYDKNFDAHTTLYNALIKGGYAIAYEGSARLVKDITHAFEKKYKPEIESTAKERDKLRKQLLKKYFD